MIIQASDQRRMEELLGAVQLPKAAHFQHGKKLGIMIFLLLAASFLAVTLVGEPADGRVTLATRIINALL